MNRDLGLVFPDIDNAQARSNQQALAMGCDGVHTKYWWETRTLSGPAAMLIVEPDTPFDATGLTQNEQAALRPVSQMSTSQGYNVCSYGAVGNGRSNPAADFFTTLASLQKQYPFATALTNEMDWLGHQLAINTASTKGGTVYTPPGTYVFTNTNSVSDGSGQLVFPTASYRDPASFAVSWGADYKAAVLKWPFALSAGLVGAVTCANRSNNDSPGYLENLTLVGPGVGSILGASATTMQGIATGDRRDIRNCVIQGFWSGINVVGGQCAYRDTVIYNCYYGIYFDKPALNLFGNMEFMRVLTDGCLMAGIAVHHQAQIASSNFYDCFFGTCPFSLYKETNNGAPAQATFSQNCTFYNCQFENVGNALIGDDRAAPSSRLVLLYQTTFVNAQFSWDNTHQVAGLAAYAIVDVRSMSGVAFLGLVNPSAWLPGTIAIFSIGASGAATGCVLSGDMEALFTNCRNAAAPKVNVFSAGNIPHYGMTILQQGPFGFTWEGRIVITSGSPAINQVVVANAGPNVIAAAGTATEVPLGVLRYVSPLSAYGVMVYKGNTTALTTGVLAAATTLRTAAGGLGMNGGSNAPFGVALGLNSGSLWSVLLRGLV